MPKILVTATVPQHIRAFHFPILEELREEGWEVEIVTNGPLEHPSIVKSHTVDWTRRPLSIGNVGAFLYLKRLINEESFDVVYCHTPVAAAITRLASMRARRRGMRVVYMAHGFHFHRGAPLRNWLIYFPIEWMLSWVTDEVLVINKERLPCRQRFHNICLLYTSEAETVRHLK